MIKKRHTPSEPSGLLAAEKHYRVNEIAEMWRFCDKTIAKLFATEPGVIRLESENSERRRYVTLSIPESVVVRVHARISAKPAESVRIGHSPRRGPVRIVKLKDLRARMAKKLPPS